MKSRFVALIVVLVGVCVLLWTTADWLEKGLQPRIHRKKAAASASTGETAAAAPAPSTGHGRGRFAQPPPPAEAAPQDSAGLETPKGAPGDSSSATAAAVPIPAFPLAAAMDDVRGAVRQYGSMFGGNPVGTNEEITRALNGGNPKEVKFLGPDGNHVTEKGELVDAWDTPYFFHQLSGKEMEIRSAGPDKKMWTADDEVVR